MDAPGGEHWRIGKANRFIVAADRAFDAGDWETAVSRAYYAVYHAVIAVLDTRAGMRRQRWNHDQLQSDFRIHFARRGFLFSMRHATDLNRLYKERLVADYERELLAERSAKDLLQRARQLYTRITEVI